MGRCEVGMCEVVWDVCVVGYSGCVMMCVCVGGGGGGGGGGDVSVISSRQLSLHVVCK